MSPLRDLFLLRDDIVFLNHGSLGACPRPVFEVYQDWQRELERQPVEFLGRRFGVLMKESRDALGPYLNADPDHLVFVPNATTGVNIIAHSIPFEKGDEILTTTHSYGAMDRTWEWISTRFGAHYVRLPVTLPLTTPESLIEEIWSGVTDQTRVLFLSHITSPSALTWPIAELIGRARERNIITVIDGAHAPGQIPLDLETLGADFYTGNCHKWLMAPKGAAFLFARPEKHFLVEPLVISWNNMSASGGRFIQELEFQGTRDIAAYLSVPAAIAFLEEHDWESVRENCRELVRYARVRLVEITGETPLCPEAGGWLNQMVAQPLPAGVDGEALKERLYDTHRIEVPVTWLEGRPLIRLSVQGYNTRADVDAFLEALGAAL